MSISPMLSRNLSTPYTQATTTTSSSTKSSRFQEGADASNRVNMWIPAAMIRIKHQSHTSCPSCHTSFHSCHVNCHVNCHASCHTCCNTSCHSCQGSRGGRWSGLTNKVATSASHLWSRRAAPGPSWPPQCRSPGPACTVSTLARCQTRLLSRSQSLLRSMRQFHHTLIKVLTKDWSQSQRYQHQEEERGPDLGTWNPR